MTLFHLNPKTGEPGLCSAQSGRCPFGSLEEHFGSSQEARKAFESSRASVSPALSKDVSSIPLASIMDSELMNKMIQQQYIYTNVHPTDSDLILLCYGVKTQIEGKWNDATKLARGLILKKGKDDLSDAEVLQRPWAKFFTLQQQESGWHLGDEENASSAEDAFTSLDFDAPAEVYDKLDGSLGILYRHPDGGPALATKGSFSSPQAETYTRMLRANDDKNAAAQELLDKRGDVTAMFELVGPANRIVLKYDEADVILLGGSTKASGANVSPEELSAWSARGLSSVERMSAKNLTEALAIPARENREGVVVSVGGANPMKIKIKQDDYLRLHRIVTMFSKKESRGLVQDLEASYGDFLTIAKNEDVSHFPTIKAVLEIDGFSKGDESYEFIRKVREDYFKEMLIPRAKQIQKAREIIDSLDKSYFEGENPSKRFAAAVKTLDGDQSTLFALYRARLEGRDVEKLDAFHEIRRAIQHVK